MKRLLFVLWLCAIAATSGIAQAATSIGAKTVSSADEMTGIHPVHMPDLKGVEQLLVLSDRWVIVVSNQMQELYDEIDRRSGRDLSKAVKLWEQSEKARRPDWGAYKARWRIRDQHIADAREAIGERKLGQTDYFRITSQNDASYAQALPPAQADRLLVSAGQSKLTGGVFGIDYFTYSYLQLPHPMLDGKSYQIRLGNGQSVTFSFDLKTTVSRAIKVNQVGYLQDAGQKTAYLGAHLYRFGPLDLSHAKRFDVVNAATGKVALQGDIKLVEKNPRFFPKDKTQTAPERPYMYGEDVYAADFTALKEEGVFFISVPGVGRSWPFRHDPAVYNQAFYTAARGLYHQRAGMALTKPYTAWTRPAAIRGPYCESGHIAFPMHGGMPKGYERFDVIGGSLNCSHPKPEVPGGWHDAADWDSNLAHYTVVFDLLNAYAFKPFHFSDNQLNIPESGNGVPDILDEARYGLEVWRYSMDARGGVSGMLEASTHTRINGEANGKRFPYAFSQRTRWSSLLFAAAAAQYAQLVKPFNAADSSLYADAALKAFVFGRNPANSLGNTVIHAKKGRGSGAPYTIDWEETEEHITPYLLHAKLRLYLLTQEASYLNDVYQLAEQSKKPYEWGFTRKDPSPWIFYSLLEAEKALPKLIGMKWRAWFIDDANRLLDQLKESAYPITLPRKQDYWLDWGSSTVTNFNRALFIAYQLTGLPKYRDAALANANFMLGANPMGMSWTTGLGHVYPIDIQHEVSQEDGILDPVPGISIYGITGGPVFHKFRETVWQSPSPNGFVKFVSHDSQRSPPLWRRWMIHPSENVAQNEFTIQETMSSTIFTAAMLSQEAVNSPGAGNHSTLPRDENVLHGRWYLP